jgi:predicted nucleic acid-binding protein
MILLDTNVISDVYRERPDPKVHNWLAAQRSADLYICTPGLAELLNGAERLPSGGRRRRLEEWIRKLEAEGFAGRILPFDQNAAHEFARLFQTRKILGRPIGLMDALIAAIARSNDAALATRDVADFADLGIDIVNPCEFGGA